jgi:hypothetical protein
MQEIFLQGHILSTAGDDALLVFLTEIYTTSVYRKVVVVGTVVPWPFQHASVE